jgi:hypothetical protein
MYSKIAVASSTRVFQRRVLRSSICIRDQSASVYSGSTVVGEAVGARVASFP